MNFPSLKNEKISAISLWGKITGSTFIKNAAVLTTGTVIAQVIPVLSMLIYARLYSDESFGIYSLFFQLTAVLGSVANGRLEQAIIVEKDEEVVVQVSQVAFTICAFISVAVFVVVSAYQLIIHFFITGITDPLRGWKFLLPLSLAFAGMLLQRSFIANRAEKYRQIAFSKIILAVISNLVPIIMVFLFAENEAGLILGLLAGQVACLLYLNRQIHHSFKPALPSKAVFKNIWKRYKSYPIINAPSLLIDQLAAALPLLFITYYYSIAQAGQFSMASRILIVPGVFIATSVAQIFFKKASDNLHTERGVKKITLNTFVILLGVGAVFFSVMIVWGQQLIPYFLGGKWQLSGVLSKWLAIAMILKFAVSPVSSALIITGRLKMLATWQFLNLVINALLVLVSVKLHLSLQSYIVMLVVSDLTMYLLYFAIIFRAVNSFESAKYAQTGTSYL